MIAHIDADAFFASALQRKRPDVKGKPLLALGMGGGCVIAASYEAKATGVKTGMRLADARKLCPKAIVLPSDFDEALLASRQIEQILRNRCPIIERMSVDEWFVDVRSLPGGVPDNVDIWAQNLQQTVLQSTSLSVSIGMGPSKLLAKMASEYRKPAGITIIESSRREPEPVLSECGARVEGSHTHSPSSCGKREGRHDTALVSAVSHPSFYISREAFLQDRPAQAIPGIGNRRGLHVQANGWQTAWDIANAPQEPFVKLFGRPGLFMQQELQGQCIDPVEEDDTPPKSISRTRSFPGTNKRQVLYSHLLHHLTYTLLKMRRAGLACKVVSVWLRNGEYQHESKDSKLPQPMDTEEQLLPYITRCFEKLCDHGTRYTQVGLALYGLNPKGGTQYSLFESPQKLNEGEQVQKAMDGLRQRFGREAIKRGGAMAIVGSKRPHLSIINE